MKIVPFLIFLFFCATATAQSTKIIGEQFLATNKNKAGVTTTPSGLQYVVLKKGDGTIPKLSDAVKVNYECKLIDGTVVDASANYGGAMQFNVAEVMPGWQEALQLMPNGSKYRLFIPSALAYGDRASGNKIKAGETLIFELEIVALNGVVAPVIVVTNTKPSSVPQPVATINVPVQLTYLGEDKIEKKIDGYASGKKTAGLVALNGKYYFATPNGNFYQTEGSEAATKVIEKFTPQDFMYLAATKRYIYYARDFGGGLVKDFVQYDPGTGKITDTRVPYNNYKKLTINGNEVPGNRQTVDEIYASPEKDKIFLRAFISDVSTVYVLDDNREGNLADNVHSRKLNMSNISMPISMNTEIGTLNNEVYFNGRVKPTGEYETSVSVYKPTEANKNKYEFKIGFEIKNQGATIYDRFLRTKEAMYSLVKTKDSSAGYKHSLFKYSENNIISSKEVILIQAADFEAQVLDDEIYVSYKGSILKFDEVKSVFRDLYYNKTETQGWDYIQKNKRFLKAGNYLLYSKDKKYTVLNTLSLKSIDLKNPTLANQPNFFTYHKSYMYAGANSFYFMDNVNGKEVFTQYNPGNNSYTPFVFPEFKKQSFGEIKAIYQADNKFVFLTSYMDKKNKPVYKMFMYTEEGNTTNTEIPTVKPVAKIFNAKLFEQQINSIIAAPKNGFANILGEVKSGGSNTAPVNYSTVAVEGIGDGTITNYKDSKTVMYNAETGRMYKEEAAAIMEIIEKQLQKIKLPFPFTKKINYDVASRKFISYEFNGKMATIDLDMLRGSDTENAANWTVTFRVRK